MKNTRKQRYRKRNYKSKKSSKKKRNTRKYTKCVKNIKKKQRKIKVRCKTKGGGGRPQEDKINFVKDKDAIEIVIKYLKDKIITKNIACNSNNVNFFVNHTINIYNIGGEPMKSTDFIIFLIKHIKDGKSIDNMEMDEHTLKAICGNKFKDMQIYDVAKQFQQKINIKKINNGSDFKYTI